MSSGRTALQLAAGDGLPRTVRLLLGAGADVNALTSPFGNTGVGDSALMIAAERGGWSSDIIVALLDAGVDVSLRNRNDETAYEIVARYRFTKEDSVGFNRLQDASVL